MTERGTAGGAVRGLAELGDGVDWPDAEAATAFRDRAARAAGTQAPRRAGELGRLGDLAEWVAGVRASTRGPAFTRIRLVVVGAAATDAVADLAADAGIGIRADSAPVETVPGGPDSVAAGAAWADAEIDSGADRAMIRTCGWSSAW